MEERCRKLHTLIVNGKKNGSKRSSMVQEISEEQLEMEVKQATDACKEEEKKLKKANAEIDS